MRESLKRLRENSWKRGVGSDAGAFADIDNIIVRDLGDDCRRWLEFAKFDPVEACRLLAVRTALLKRFPIIAMPELYQCICKAGSDEKGNRVEEVKNFIKNTIKGYLGKDDPAEQCDKFLSYLLGKSILTPKELEGVPAYRRYLQRRALKLRWIVPVLSAILSLAAVGTWFWWNCTPDFRNVNLVWPVLAAILAAGAFVLVCKSVFRLVYIPPRWLGLPLAVGCFSLPLLQSVLKKDYHYLALAAGAVLLWALVFAAAKKYASGLEPRKTPLSGSLLLRGVEIAGVLVLTLGPLFWFHHYPFPWGRLSRSHGDYDREMSVISRKRRYRPVYEAYVKAWRVSADYAGRKADLLKALEKEARKKTSDDFDWKKLESGQEVFSKLDPAQGDWSVKPVPPPWYRELKERFVKALKDNGEAVDYYAAFRKHDALKGEYIKFFGRPDEKIERGCYICWLNKVLDDVLAGKNADAGAKQIKFLHSMEISRKAKKVFPDLMDKPELKEKRSVIEKKMKKVEEQIVRDLEEATKAGGEKWDRVLPEVIRAFDDREYVISALYERGHKASGIAAHDEKYLAALESWEPRTADRLIRCAEHRRARGESDRALADLDAACGMGNTGAMRLFTNWSKDTDPRVRNYLKKLFDSNTAQPAEVLRLARLSFRFGEWETAYLCYGAVSADLLNSGDRHNRAMVFRKKGDGQHEFDELAAALRGGYRQSLPEDLARCCELGQLLKRMDDLYGLLETLAAAGCTGANERYIECAYELKRVNPGLWHKLRPYFARNQQSRRRFVLVGKTILPPAAFYTECENAVKAKCAEWEKLAEEAALFAFADRQYARAVGFFRMIPSVATGKRLSEYARALWGNYDLSADAVKIYVRAIRNGGNGELALDLGEMFDSSEPDDRMAAVYVWDLAIQSADDPRTKGMAADKIVGVVCREKAMGESGKYPFLRDEARRCCKGYGREKKLARLGLAYEAGGFNAVRIIADAHAWPEAGGMRPEICKKFPDLGKLLEKIDGLLNSGILDNSENKVRLQRLRKHVQDKLR